MNITKRRHSQELAQRSEILSRRRVENLFITDEIYCFAVCSRDVQAVVQPHAIFFSENYIAAKFAESSRNITPSVRRSERPTRRLKRPEFPRRIPQHHDVVVRRGPTLIA